MFGELNVNETMSINGGGYYYHERYYSDDEFPAWVTKGVAVFGYGVYKLYLEDIVDTWTDIIDYYNNF